MTFLTQDQANKVLSSSKNVMTRITQPQPVQIIERVNSNHSYDVTDPIKLELLAYCSDNPNKSEREVAEIFNISITTVNSIKNGTRDKNESPSVKKYREEKREEASDHAMQKMMETLGLIDNSKLENCNAKELSSIANNMSKIVSNLRKKDEVGDASRTNIQIYMPTQRTEESFKVIEVG